MLLMTTKSENVTGTFQRHSPYLAWMVKGKSF